jgi:hypothetical protein
MPRRARHGTGGFGASHCLSHLKRVEALLAMSALTAPNAFRRREGNFHKLEATHDHRNSSASPSQRNDGRQARGRFLNSRSNGEMRACASLLKSGTLSVLPARSPLGRAGDGLRKDVLTIIQSAPYALGTSKVRSWLRGVCGLFASPQPPRRPNDFSSTISRSMRRMKLSSCLSADRRRLQLCRGARTWIACRQCAGGAGSGAVVARSSKPRRRSRRRFSWVASVSVRSCRCPA